MANDTKIREHAELIVNTCFTVEKGDVVTIITDDAHAHLADVVADVAAEKGAWPVIMNNEAQVSRGLADTLFPMAPPKNLHDAMLAADEIIIMTNLEWANRFAHVSAVRESCANNVKIASVEGGHGRVGPHGRGHPRVHRPRRGGDRQAQGRAGVPRLDAGGHRRHGLHRGPPRPPGDADPPAGLDDGAAAALGRGRVRRARGPHERRHRGHRQHARDRRRRRVASRSSGT